MYYQSCVADLYHVFRCRYCRDRGVFPLINLYLAYGPSVIFSIYLVFGGHTMYRVSLLIMSCNSTRGPTAKLLQLAVCISDSEIIISAGLPVRSRKSWFVDDLDFRLFLHNTALPYPHHLWRMARLSEATTLLFLLCLTTASATQHGGSGLKLPLHLGSRAGWKRDGKATGIGLGDASDV